MVAVEVSLGRLIKVMDLKSPVIKWHTYSRRIYLEVRNFRKNESSHLE